MTLTVLICDDSSLARRQMARSLPANWDIELSYAQDGSQAIEAIKAGRADLLFLDLNMPVMNGFEVLDMIRVQDLPTMVLVVSGDIQPEARARVMSKGALDFIRKPVSPEQVATVLERYGILSMSDFSIETPAITKSPQHWETDFCEALREVVNVAMGQAGNHLSTLLKTFIRLPVPTVYTIPYQQLPRQLSCSDSASLSAVSHGFSGNNVAGEGILLIRSDCFEDLGALLARNLPAGSNSVTGILTDLSELLIGACLKGISQQLDIEFNHSYPVLLGHEQTCDALLNSTDNTQTVLAVEIIYQLESQGLDCHLLLLFTEDSIPALRSRVELLIEDTASVQTKGQAF
jgi:CheY-like chemotaxis protein